LDTDKYDEEAMESGPAESHETEPASDFDVAADAVATELGAEPTATFRSALKEAIMACMGGDYDAPAEGKAAKKPGGLALIFGGK
jgi:hypothetical protein